VSLINEALKRTRDASYQNAARGSTPASAPYRAAGGLVPTNSSRRLWIAISALTGAVLIGSLLFFALRAVAAWPRAHDNDRRAAAAAPSSVSPAMAPAVVPPSPPPPAPAPVDTRAMEDQVAAKVLERIKAEQSAAPKPVMPPVPPPFVVTGFQTIGNVREAVVNGRPVRVGDTIQGAKVIAIDRPVVRLLFAGQEFEYAM
jgi:hypothetical protein